MRTTATLLDRLRQRVGRSTEPAEVRRALREEMVAMLDAPPPPAPTGRPWVILVTGVNGVGKTTTIGKLGARQAEAGRRDRKSTRQLQSPDHLVCRLLLEK